MHDPKKPKLVVIGNGMAGARVVEEILKRAPDQFAATAYAYTYVLAAAAKNGKSATQDAITAQLTAITGTKSVSTLLGKFRFDAARNGISPVTVQEVVKQKFTAFKPN